MQFQRSRESIGRWMEWSCVRVGVEQAASTPDKARARKFFETVVFLRSARRTHRGDGALRGERGVGGGCL